MIFLSIVFKWYIGVDDTTLSLYHIFILKKRSLFILAWIGVKKLAQLVAGVNYMRNSKPSFFLRSRSVKIDIRTSDVSLRPVHERKTCDVQ